MLEAIIAIDDAAIEIVEIGCCKTPAVQRNHGAKIWRNDRDDIEDHPLGADAVDDKTLNELHPPHQLLPLQALRGLKFCLEFFLKGFQIGRRKERAQGFCANAGFKKMAIPHGEVAIGIFRNDLEGLEIFEFSLGKVYSLIQSRKSGSFFLQDLRNLFVDELFFGPLFSRRLRSAWVFD